MRYVCCDFIVLLVGLFAKSEIVGR
jgi:hypothetical protein